MKIIVKINYLVVLVDVLWNPNKQIKDDSVQKTVHVIRTYVVVVVVVVVL